MENEARGRVGTIVGRVPTHEQGAFLHPGWTMPCPDLYSIVRSLTDVWYTTYTRTRTSWVGGRREDQLVLNIYIHIYMYIYICMIRLLSYINMMQLEPRSLFNLFFQTQKSLSQPSQSHNPSHPLHVILRMDSRAACINTSLF